MADLIEYRLKIEAFTKDTIPMFRLIEYLADLVDLLGEKSAVHFDRVEEGSVVPVVKVSREAAPKVEERIDRVRRGDGPSDAMRAYTAINEKLREDNGTGLLQTPEPDNVLQFPGRLTPRPQRIGPVRQEGTIDGIVIRLGGINNWVPVHVETSEGVTTCCWAKRDMARRLGPHIFGGPLRLVGGGKWYRERSGSWSLESFTISDFRPLNAEPLSKVIGDLRSLNSATWHDDVLERIASLRDDA